MKKFLVIFLLFLTVCVGCGKQEEEKTNKIDEEKIIKETKENIISYIKGNMIDTWSYKDGKVIIDDEYNTTIKLFNSDNWVVCHDSAKKSILELKKDNFENAPIKTLNFICYKDEGTTIESYANLKDFKLITDDNFNANVEMLDKDKKVITENLETARVRIKNEYKNKCQKYSYKEIFRNSEKYEGKLARFTGQVIQVMEDDGYYMVRMDVTKDKWGYYEDTIMVLIPIESFKGRILEDDIITVYGVLSGLYTYESVFGSSVTIPSMIAQYADLTKG